MIEKPKIKITNENGNITQLKKKVNNLDKMIDNYTLLKEDTNNVGEKKSYEFFVSYMVKKKLNIQEIIDDIYSSIIPTPSEE